METRILFHPKTKRFFNCGNSDHAIYCHNKKLKDFDGFIRGIIVDKILYLRVFCPDIENKTFEEIKDYSFSVCFDNLPIIEAELRNYGFKINKVVYNANNEMLKNICCYS